MEKAAQLAERNAEKQCQKEAYNASKAMRPFQKIKPKASESFTGPKKRVRGTGTGVVGAAAPAPPVKVTSRGRKIRTPNKSE